MRNQPYEQLESLQAWLTSQRDWHDARVRRSRGWHWSQRNYYRLQLRRRIPIWFIVERTIRKHTPALLDNIAQSNALFRRLKNAGIKT